jgi:mono/diheme cytochrome c family protein
VLCLLVLGLGGGGDLSADEWLAPAAASSVINPTAPSPDALSQGGAIYRQNCLICHGSDGRGDGQGATYLIPKPASFAVPSFHAESDGAVFWKITTGRNAMPGFASLLSEPQRWQLVDYLRAIARDPASANTK